jgi:hypothetical protein
MRQVLVAALFLGLSSSAVSNAKTVVFVEPGFPTLESEPVSRELLIEALAGQQPVFAGIDELIKPEALRDAALLVLPYGSAFPADAWPAIKAHLERGGNLLTLGGRALWIPVWRAGETFRADRPQNTYWRLLSFVNAEAVPQRAFERFTWQESFSFLRSAEIRAQRVFAFNSQHVVG